jgi:hypothetical protein
MCDHGGSWRRIHEVRFAAALAGLLLVSACGAEEREPAARDSPGTADEVLYEADATVLESSEHGPMLCLGIVLTSLPPQCGDVPVDNWSWDAVDGEESAAGSTWSAFHVVGTYDGRRFTLARVGPLKKDIASPEPERDFTPPCPAPEGGWAVPKPEKSTQEDARSAEAYAMRQREYVASWVFHLKEPSETDTGDENTPVVYVAMFTSSAQRHEAEIRRRWRGPLCVVEHPGPTQSEADRLRAKAESAVGAMGLRMTWSDGGDPGQIAHIGVVADPGERGQAALDADYGRGRVILFPALKPVG